MQWVTKRILEEIEVFKESNERAPTVACMGLAFKPNIDDLRESPAVSVFQSLVQSGNEPIAVEPNLKSHKSIVLTDYNEAVKQADIVVYLVAHNEFKELPVKRKILDFCGVTVNQNK